MVARGALPSGGPRVSPLRVSGDVSRHHPVSRGQACRPARPTAHAVYGAALLRLLTAGFVQVFGRRRRRPSHALQRPASEKRQGTKLREGTLGRPCRWLSYGDLSGERAACMRFEAGDGAIGQRTSRKAAAAASLSPLSVAARCAASKRPRTASMAASPASVTKLR
jgi:hypothetical protein